MAVLAAFGVALLLGGYGYWKFRSIDRVDLAGVLSPPASGTNYLIIGTDSRAGVDLDNPNAGVIFGEGIGGTADEPLRTDTIVVLKVGPDRNTMMSLPRDLLVPISGTGSSQRINTAIQGGPERLVRTVQDLGIPVHHYLEIDFAGFIGLVDNLGGITVDFAYPAYDDRSGLSIDTAGPRKLNGDDALAYVRSRHYTEIIDGQPRTDPTSDLGRVQRQQVFLRSVFSSMSSTKNPWKVRGVIAAVSDTVRFDQDLGFFTAINLARKLGALPETVILPTAPATTPDGAAVLLLTDGSAEVIGQFG